MKPVFLNQPFSIVIRDCKTAVTVVECGLAQTERDGMKLLLVCLACCVVGCGGGNHEARIAKLEKDVADLLETCKSLYLADRDNFDRDMDTLEAIKQVKLKLIEVSD
jgi:hypothetical protein